MKPIQCNDCDHMMIETNDHQITECEACGRDDCLNDDPPRYEVISLVSDMRVTTFRQDEFLLALAAPRLLAALEQAESCLSDFCSSPAGDFARLADNAAVDLIVIRAAIAEAEGSTGGQP